MAPPWDVFGVGCAVGGTAGLVLGYQIRKLITKLSDRRLIKRDIERRSNDEIYAERATRLGLPPVMPIERKRSRRSTPQTPQRIPIVPSEHNGFLSEPLRQEVKSPWRDDVIAALTGAGYSKAEAVKATDACSMVERATGLEAWTRAALTNASRSKP